MHMTHWQKAKAAQYAMHILDLVQYVAVQDIHLQHHTVLHVKRQTIPTMNVRLLTAVQNRQVQIQQQNNHITEHQTALYTKYGAVFIL